MKITKSSKKSVRSREKIIFLLVLTEPTALAVIKSNFLTS